MATPVTPTPSKAPTRKWWAAQVVALSAVAVAALTANHFGTVEIIGLVGWVTQAAVTWLVPNDPTPGGVPTA